MQTSFSVRPRFSRERSKRSKLDLQTDDLGRADHAQSLVEQLLPGLVAS